MDKNLYSYWKLLFLCALNVLILNQSRSSASEDIQLYPNILDTKIGKRFPIKCTANITDFSIKTCPILQWNIDTQNVTPGAIEEIKENLITLSFNNNYTRLNGNFYCKIYKQPDNDICDIKIGQPPKEIQDFKCLFVDLNELICNFTESDNYVNTSYHLDFYKDNLPYNDEYKNQIETENCPINKTLATRFCTPVYVGSIYQYYNFNLTSENIFGSNFQNFSIHQFKNVLFSKPTVQMANKSPDSITIQWEGIYVNRLQILNKFCKNQLENNSCVIYDVRIKPKFDPNWRTVQFTNDIFVPPTNRLSFQNKIEGLNPYTRYKIEMRMKAVNASNRLWSERGGLEFQTLCRNPDMPPKVDIGSFHIDNNGYIQIYWKLLEKSEENCDNVSYSLSTISGKESIKTAKILDTMIKLNVKADEDYKFEIKSSNSMGYSKNGSIVIVPKELNRFPSPRYLRNIVKGGEYHFSWEPPENITGILDYTVFWCRYDPLSADHCKKSSINFYHVNSSVTTITHNETDDLKFAVAANSISSSSGMIWTKCVAAIDTKILPFEPAIEVKATSIRLRLNFECGQRTIIERFVVSCCASNGTYCDNRSIITLSSKTEEHEIHFLKPYTNYTIIIDAISANFEKKTFSVTKTTLQAAPSPPQNLTVRDITNTTITLTWNRPEDLRGILQYYEVYYNNVPIKIDNNMEPKDEETFILKDLESYHEYEIYVIAHTIRDSNPSNRVKLRTAIGTPGSINQPKITGNQTDITISWQPPLTKSGRMEFYEIKRVTVIDNEKNKIFYKIFSTICHLNITETCNGNIKNIFSVRAINIAPSTNYLKNNIQLNFEQKFEFQERFNSIIPIRSNSTIINCEDDKNIEHWLNSVENQSVELIEGNWSTSSNSSACQYSAESSGLLWYIIVGIIGVIVLLLFLVAFGIYGYKAYKKHSDIDCIPPPLNPSGYKLNVTDNITYLPADLHNDISSRRSSSGFHEECYEYVLPQTVEHRIDDKKTYVKQMDPIDCIDLVAPDGYLQMNVYQEMRVPNLPYDSDSVRSSFPDTDKL